MAKECDYQPAADALMDRHGHGVSALIARRMRQARLGAADVEDAKQEGWFWMREAIERFDTRELARPKGCRFRTILQTVIGSRVIDFARSIWRRQSHFEEMTGVLDPADIPTAVIRLGRPRADGCHDDPLAALLWQETLLRLQLALDGLGTKARALWQLLASGMDLRDIARQLGISYQQVRGQRQQLLAKLKARFREER
jgi:RNA polymerase sigma factor (sigma-70 family)